MRASVADRPCGFSLTPAVKSGTRSSRVDSLSRAPVRLGSCTAAFLRAVYRYPAEPPRPGRDDSSVPAALMGLHPSQCCSRPRSPPRLRSSWPTCRFPSVSRPVVFTGSRPRDPVCLGHSPTSGPDRCDDHAHAAWVAVICPAGRARPSRLLGLIPAGDPPPLPAVFPLSAGEADVTALGFGPSLRSSGVRRRDTRDRRRGNPTRSAPAAPLASVGRLRGPAPLVGFNGEVMIGTYRTAERRSSCGRVCGVRLYSSASVVIRRGSSPGPSANGRQTPSRSGCLSRRQSRPRPIATRRGTPDAIVARQSSTGRNTCRR